MKQKAAAIRCSTRGLCVDVLWFQERWQHVRFFFWCLPFSSLTSSSFSFYVAAIVCGDDTVLLTQTPSRMSQRQVKERDKEREKEKEKEKEVGLQTPNREQLASPSTLSPGVSYSHGKICIPKHWFFIIVVSLHFVLVRELSAQWAREREREGYGTQLKWNHVHHGYYRSARLVMI